MIVSKFVDTEDYTLAQQTSPPAEEISILYPLSYADRLDVSSLTREASAMEDWS